MNIINEILGACESEKNHAIKKFNGFTIKSKLGSGQQGVVLKVENRISKQFALKFYHPADIDPTIIKESIKRFEVSK